MTIDGNIMHSENIILADIQNLNDDEPVFFNGKRKV